MKKILPILIIGILVLSGLRVFAMKVDSTDSIKESINEAQTYTNNGLPNPPINDLVIIAPSVFSKELQRLVTHKNETGIKTILKTTEDIYDEYEGVDKPEQIKYFIKYAIEEWNVSYVLLVGGLKSLIWAIPRDTTNYGAKHWHLPVRYTNLHDDPKYPLSGDIKDPGIISDLYYSDIYKYNESSEEYEFEDWDPNNDGVFAAWDCPGVENDTGIDLIPDVALGRLACRNKREVRTVVDKIINYETTTYGQEWFNKIMVFSGDGFLDQEDLDIQWNTTDTTIFPDGKYTIYAQSHNEDGIAGGIDHVKITLDRSVESSITFTHDDHLQVKSYPAPPVAEITSPSCGDILGNTDVHFAPEKFAYDNEFSGWANVTYQNGIMYIRGKSYDPQPYGVKTDIHVWVKNEDDQIVFSEWKYDLEMYYEGEWATGEKLLNGRGGALYYMPDTFEKDIYWGSNGRLTGQKDLIKAFSKGCGFVFMSGHGSPNVWADHFPGIPGDRKYGSFTGLEVTGLRIWPPFVKFPISPMNQLRNNGKLPVVIIGGCHNSQFNVSFIRSLLDMKNKNSMWTHGSAVSECFSWRLVSLPRRGAIATIGNTGLGYGRVGIDATSGGGDAWITIEFFRQYGEEGHKILGDAFTQAVVSYIDIFESEMNSLEEGHAKTVQQWALLGDPSLRIGGFH